MIRPKCARCGEVFQGYGMFCEKCADKKDNGAVLYGGPVGGGKAAASRDKAPVNAASRDRHFPDLGARLDALEARFAELEVWIAKRRDGDRERQRRKRASLKS